MHDGLWMVVNAAGTGGRGRIVGRDVSGKTGTAQVISLTGAKIARGKMDVRDHGWFVFFAPRDNPVLAGVIFAEHSEHGYLGAPDREARDRDLLREEGRKAAAGAAEAAASGGRDCRHDAGAATQRESHDYACSNAVSIFTSTGCSWQPW